MHKNIVWFYLILIVSVVMLLSVFKNLSFPLLWNDEGETVAYAQRIIKFGYPAVDDGKNILNLTEVPDKKITVRGNAWIHLPWVQYYYAVIGVLMANITNDFYLKTFLVRFPFALAGLLGVLVFGFSILQLFKKGSKRYIFFIIYSLFFLISISLILHIREARSYPVTLLLSSLISYLYIRYRFLGKIGFRLYCILFILLSILLLNTFPPAFVALMTLIGLYEVKGIIMKPSGYLNLLPLVFTFIFSIPYLWFFRVFQISSYLARSNNFDIGGYFFNLTNMFKYFSHFELLYFALFLKTLFFILAIPRWQRIKNDPVVRTSIFYSFYFIFYAMVTSNVPYIFERYYIVMMAILLLVTVIDIYLVNIFLAGNAYKNKIFLAGLAVLFLNFIQINKMQYVKGHIYEMFNQYKGPMDYIIPFIKSTYKDTSSLIIATNYEEDPYVYYLDSKVIIGYVGNNMEEDKREEPDVVIIRKNHPNNVKELSSFLDRYKYKKVTFATYDYLWNNIPAISLAYPHLFKEIKTIDDVQKVEVYYK